MHTTPRKAYKIDIDIKAEKINDFSLASDISTNDENISLGKNKEIMPNNNEIKPSINIKGFIKLSVLSHCKFQTSIF